MSAEIMDGKEFVRRLSFLLDYSEKTYRTYLKSNKQFKYALILYGINTRISDLLTEHSHILSAKAKADSIELLLHIDVWSVLWKDEVKKQQPKISDIFAFENDVNFPKESVARLLSG